MEESITSFPRLDHESLLHIATRIKSGSPADPCPPSIFKLALPAIEGEVLTLINLSLETGKVPRHFKEARVTPLLKKVGADTTNMKNYRPISPTTFPG